MNSSTKTKNANGKNMHANWSIALHCCVFLVFGFRKSYEYKTVCLPLPTGRDGPNSQEPMRLI